MKYTIENQKLKISVNSMGAELCSVVYKEDGTEHLWQGDPAVWSGQAPIMFPYTGRLPGGKFSAKGAIYEGNPHGFARNAEHTMVRCEGNLLVLELLWNEELLARWPWKFRLESTFLLEGETLHHTLRVENLDEESFSFGIGYHPAFRIPFDEKHTFEDYELRFEKIESPLCLNTSNGGLVGESVYYLGKNITAFPINEKLFANDSHMMTGLRSGTLGIYEKDSGRAVVADVSGFPYVLLWSKPGVPQFVCIEPWHSTPSPVGEDIAWENKPAAAILTPGESWQTTMRTVFTR